MTWLDLNPQTTQLPSNDSGSAALNHDHPLFNAMQVSTDLVRRHTQHRHPCNKMSSEVCGLIRCRFSGRIYQDDSEFQAITISHILAHLLFGIVTNKRSTALLYSRLTQQKVLVLDTGASNMQPPRVPKVVTHTLLSQSSYEGTSLWKCTNISRR